MVGLRGEENSWKGTSFILVVGTLPLTGILVFEWRVYQALFVYWVEIGLTVFFYFVIVLFAQRESKPEQKRGGSYPGPIPIPRQSGTIRPVSRLPPIRYQNIRFVPAALPVVTAIWFFSSRIFVEYTNFSVSLGSQAYFSEYITYIAAAYSPEGLVVAFVLFGVNAVFSVRDYFARGLVEQYSAAMLMEIPCRIVLFWFVILIALAPVGPLVAAADISQPNAITILATIIVTAKLAVDRSLVRIRHEDDPGWFAGLFAPNERKPEYQFETSSDDYPQ